MNREKIPNSVIYVAGDVLGSWYFSHTKLNTLFGSVGFPDDPPLGNCVQKCQAWFRRANDTQEVEPLVLLGLVLVEFMNLGLTEEPRWSAGFQRINEALKKNGYAFQMNGHITAIGLASRTTTEPVKSQIGHVIHSETSPGMIETHTVVDDSPIIVL